MSIEQLFNKKGVTLIELLVALILCGLVIAGIYRLFIAQTKAYTVQDQVVEVQQNIRNAMGILLRDLRMTGFDSDSKDSKVIIVNPLITPLGDSSITVEYEYNDTNKYTVAYRRDAATSRMIQQLTVTEYNNDGSVKQVDARPSEILLENVDALSFTYGVDESEDGVMDDLNGNGIIDNNDWVAAANVGTRKVVAVRMVLTARPEQVNPDLQMVSPRTLTSAVTLRNLCLIK